MMPTPYVLLFVWAAFLHVDGLRVEDDEVALATQKCSDFACPKGYTYQDNSDTYEVKLFEGNPKITCDGEKCVLDEKNADFQKCCRAYAGTCENGKLPKQENRNQDNQCEECDPGYKLHENTCTAYAGTCENGKLPKQENRNSDNQCEECDPGYKLHENTCTAITCNIGMWSDSDGSKKLAVTYPACIQGTKKENQEFKGHYWSKTKNAWVQGYQPAEEDACEFNLNDMTFPNGENIQDNLYRIEATGDCKYTVLVDQDKCNAISKDNYVIKGQQEKIKVVTLNSNAAGDPWRWAKNDLEHDTCKLIVVVGVD